MGVKNASLKVKDIVLTDLDTTQTNVAIPLSEIYTLYKDNGYVIAAVVIGEDDGVSSNYAYITGDDYTKESYNSEDDEWTWSLEAIVNGEKTELNEAGSTIKYLDDMDQGEWYEVKYDAKGNVRGYKTISWKTPDGSATPNPGKYIKEVVDVEPAVEDHDTVLLWVDYNTTAGYLTFNGKGTVYTDKAKTQGFSVSPDVKTVVSLSLLKKDGKTIVPFDDVTDGYTGYKGLENAIADLDTNFKGYLGVLLENGIATCIVLDDRTGTAVDTGNTTTPTGSYSSVVDAELAAAIAGDPLNLEKAKVDDTNTLILPAHYGQNVKQQLRDALAHLGYKVTGEEYNSTSKVWTFQTEKDGVTSKITCDVTKNSGNIGVTAAEYALVDVDDTKEYVAVGDTVTVTAPTTNPGIGYIVKATGDADFAYGNAYATAYTVVTGKDAEIKSGYVNVALDGTSFVTGTNSAKAGTTVLTSGGYVKAGGTVTVTVTLTKNTSATKGGSVALSCTGGTVVATTNPQTFTDTQIKAGDVTLTFQITAASAAITAVKATVTDAN